MSENHSYYSAKNLFGPSVHLDLALEIIIREEIGVKNEEFNEAGGGEENKHTT